VVLVGVRSWWSGGRDPDRAPVPVGTVGGRVAVGLLATARAVRERVDPFVPLLAWQGGDGGSLLVMLPHDPDDPGGLALAVRAALDVLEAERGRAVWFAVVVDAYGRAAGPADGVAAGDLGDLFRGGDPGVVEQLMMLMARGGASEVWRQVYRWTPVDGWEWDDGVERIVPVLPDMDLLDLLVERSR